MAGEYLDESWDVSSGKSTHRQALDSDSCKPLYQISNQIDMWLKRSMKMPSRQGLELVDAAGTHPRDPLVA